MNGALSAALLIGGVAFAAELPLPLFAMTDSRARPVIVQDEAGKPLFDTFYDLTAKGVAFSGPRMEYHLQGGTYRAERIGQHVASSLNRTGEWTVELYIEPEAGRSGGCIAAYGKKKEPAQAMLEAVDGGKARWSAGGTTLDFALAPGGRHVLITGGKGATSAFVDGRLAGSIQVAAQPIWLDGDLCFGADAAGKTPWYGVVRAATLRHAAVGAEQAQALAAERLAAVKALPPIPRSAARGKLLAMSQFEEPEYVAYNKAYVLCDYQVGGQTMRVAQWLFLGRKLLTTSTRVVGEEYALELEPMSDHPELTDEQGYDTLEPALDAKVSWDAAPVAYPVEAK